MDTVDMMMQRVDAAEKVLATKERIVRESGATGWNMVAMNTAFNAFSRAQKEYRLATRGFYQTYPHPCASAPCSHNH